MDVNGQNNISIWIKILSIVSRSMFIILIFMLPYNNVYANLNTNKVEENKLTINCKEPN